MRSTARNYSSPTKPIRRQSMKFFTFNIACPRYLQRAASQPWLKLQRLRRANCPASSWERSRFFCKLILSLFSSSTNLHQGQPMSSPFSEKSTSPRTKPASRSLYDSPSSISETISGTSTMSNAPRSDPSSSNNPLPSAIPTRAPGTDLNRSRS